MLSRCCVASCGQNLIAWEDTNMRYINRDQAMHLCGLRKVEVWLPLFPNSKEIITAKSVAQAKRKLLHKLRRCGSIGISLRDIKGRMVRND
jgi:hypothetical protein